MKLQNRWKIEGKYLIYYGLRQPPYTNKNKIKLSSKERRFISSLFCVPVDDSFKVTKKIKSLITQGIIVDDSKVKNTPADLSGAVFCNNCIANDFIIPGIEFNNDGLCPMCAAKEIDKKLNSILPVKNKILPSKKGRFDVAVFYTGGKDSTYLLYYFAKVCGLRVLALTWEIPYISDNAKQSIENAKKNFPNVEFATRTMASCDLNKIYKKLFTLQNNTCACPSLAYVLFYPLLCAEKIPYLVLGNEPVQMKQLYYNNIAPRIAYRFQDMNFVRFLLNTGRLFILKKPLKKGQLEMLALIKQLAFGDNFFKKISGYKNELISNICVSLDEAPNLKSTLKKVIKKSDRRALMPALVHFDFNSTAGGSYDWDTVKDLLAAECGWVSPAENDKGLHASCVMEKVKDYSQFKRFYDMKSTLIPFSALEISLASSSGNISKEKALDELKNHLGLVLQIPDEYKYLHNCAVENDKK